MTTFDMQEARRFLFLWLEIDGDPLVTRSFAYSHPRLGASPCMKIKSWEKVWRPTCFGRHKGLDPNATILPEVENGESNVFRTQVAVRLRR